MLPNISSPRPKFTASVPKIKIPPITRIEMILLAVFTVQQQHFSHGFNFSDLIFQTIFSESIFQNTALMHNRI